MAIAGGSRGTVAPADSSVALVFQMPYLAIMDSPGAQPVADSRGATFVRPLLALALLVPAPTIGALAALWIIPGKVGSIVYTASKVWILLFPVAWTMLVERRVQGREHLRRREFLGLACSGRGIITGALQGTVIAVLIIGVFLAVRRGIDAGSLRQVAGAAGFGTIRAYVLLGTYLALVNSLLEEYVWRWFVFRAVHSVLGGWGAVIVSAMLFTVHHVVVLLAYFPAWLALLASGGVFIGGVAWSWCFLRFRSILPGYLSHVIVDIAVLVVGWVLLFAPAS